MRVRGHFHGQAVSFFEREIFTTRASEQCESFGEQNNLLSLTVNRNTVHFLLSSTYQLCACKTAAVVSFSQNLLMLSIYLLQILKEKYVVSASQTF
jgi:hypothetical protein